MILQFKNDTLYLNDPTNGNIVEMMNYKIRGDTLTIVKIGGGSSCNDVKGIIKFQQRGELFMTLINDSC